MKLTIQQIRTWIGIGFAAIFGVIIVFLSVIPEFLFSEWYYIPLLLIAVFSSGGAVLVYPGFFNRWQGLLVLGFVLVVIPNIWIWTLPTDSIMELTSTQQRISLVAILMLLSGLGSTPISFARNLWRRDMSCFMAMLFLMLNLWGTIAHVWYFGSLDDRDSFRLDILVKSIELGTTVLFITATVMFLVNLVRLIWQEVRVE
jgi:hypothetical protein